MAGASINLGVDVTSFKQGMREAQAEVKTLDQELKRNEAQLKATGDKEQYMADKANLLQMKLQTQKVAATNLEKALKTMRENGVKASSVEYQNLQRQLSAAQTEMLNTQVALNELTAGEQAAAKGAETLGDSIGGISKKMSLQQVIGGIDKITGALENAAKKAVNLGQAIWENVMDSAKWADDTQTMALMYGVDLDTYLRVEKLVQSGLDTTTDAILKSQSKLRNNVGKGSDSFTETLRELNLLRQAPGKGGGTDEFITADSVELFWEAGAAIMNLADEYEQEAKAQELFGKSWRELIPLFTAYKSQEEFEEALAGVTVNTEEEVDALAELNDKVSELKANFDTLETKVLAGLAPALTEGAEALNGLLQSLLDYLAKPEGQQMLDRLGTAVSGLFEDLSNIDPQQVVEGFVGVFERVVGGLEWLANNSGTVIGALEAIVVGWGALKLTGGALQMLNLLNGLNTMRGYPIAGNESSGGNTGILPDVTSSGASAGGTGGGWLAMLLDNATLVAAAAAVSKATDPRNSEAAKDVEELVYALEHNEMTMEEVTAHIIEHDFAGFRRVALENAEKGPSFWDVVAASAADAKGRWESWGGQMYGSLVNFEQQYLPNAFRPIGPNLTKAEREKQMQEWNEVLKELDAKVEPELADDAEEQLQEQASRLMVKVGVNLVPVSFTGGGGGGGGGKFGVLSEHANGLWSVPWDGYPAILHKGERVMPAREVSSRNFSSNLYVESMYMNNGTDANGLAAAMAAAQRRTMSGYGS